MKKMKLRLFSLLLAAAVCFGAAVPVAASAAGVASVLFGSIPYYGDPSACRMTAEQAEAYVALLQDEITAAQEEVRYDFYGAAVEDPDCKCYAALIDFGDGIPALYFASGTASESPFGDVALSLNWEGFSGVTTGFWGYRGGSTVPIGFPEMEMGYSGWYRIYPDRLVSFTDTETFELGTETKVFPIINGAISASPDTTSNAHYNGTSGDQFTIDGQPATKEQYNAWLEAQTSGEAFISSLYGNYGRFGGLTGVGPVEPVLAALNAYAAAARGGAAALLETLPYYGDAAACRMSSEQALALADHLEAQAARDEADFLALPASVDIPTTYGPFGAYAALFDTGSGIPSLYYAAGYTSIYEPPTLESGFFDISTPYIWQYVDGRIQVAPVREGYIYQDYLTVKKENGAVLHAEVPPYVDGVISDSASTVLDTDYLSYYTIDGRAVSQQDFTNWRTKWLGDSPLSYEMAGNIGQSCRGFVPAGDVVAVLRAYAELSAVPMYTFPLAQEDSAYYQEVTEAVSGRGTVRSVYELLEDLYYVLLENQGTYSGALVQGVTRNGKPVWEVSEVNEEPAEESALEALVSRLLSSPNLMLDFSKLRGTPEAEELRDYLEDLLANYDGLSPNDAALTELAAFLDSAVSAAVAYSVRGKDNRLTLDKKLVSDLAEGAVSVWEDLLGTLEERGVALNKTVTPRARLLWKDFDADKACQITVEKSLVSGLNGADLQLLLGGGERYIQLSYENLRQLIDELGGFSIQFSRTGENQYGINFLDEGGDVLDSLPSPVILGLPAASMTSTVMASYTGGSDNWGGQYDETAGVLAFETRYSGQYEVMENSVQIADIADLSEDAQTAIRFLVSKGYLSLDENGLFNPWQPLTRYDFTRTLVSMFFALDRSLSAPFADVPEESEYYAYVASAKANGLVQGVTETSFEGEQNLSVEQMLTVTGRTLAERKGYAVPEDAEVYLSVFTDGGAVSEWAREHTALSVREGLKDRGGMLEPQGSITREQAAVALYRLFLRLYEVPPIALDLPPESEEVPEEEKEDGVSESGEEPGNGTVILIASATGAAVLAGAAAAVIILKKRKTTAGK